MHPLITLILLTTTLIIPPKTAEEILWSGAVTDQSASVVVGNRGGETFQVATDQHFSNVVFEMMVPDGSRLHKFLVDGLVSGTRYYYGFDDDYGSFKTFGNQSEWKLLLGSASQSSTNSNIFLDMKEQEADVLIYLGDMFIEDININNIELYNQAYRKVFNSTQKHLLKSLPVVYMWDDHDYGTNNANYYSISKEAAMEAYNLNVPHYPLAIEHDGLSPIYHAFNLGTVRVVVTDLRSEKKPEVEQIMSRKQLQWLRDEFAEYKQYSVVLWINTQIWIGESSSADNWRGFSSDRAIISNIILELGIDNLVSVTSDSHMLAMDDGTYSDYSALGGAGFPMFNVGSLDRSTGNSIGGPFSHGCFSYENHRIQQYGTLIINNTNTSTPCFKMIGHTIDISEPVLEFEKCYPWMKRGFLAEERVGITSSCLILYSKPYITVWLLIGLIYCFLSGISIILVQKQQRIGSLILVLLFFILVLLFLLVLNPVYVPIIVFPVCTIAWIIVAISNRERLEKFYHRKVKTH
eukprot:TRINITY_DN10848_c0_g1_i1.p1 TRINITY_DN10848_c0_g1~~TRINITY_DN10848_c0_g1_i1.p1  ORF type:complete len:521 (+),score=81.40 TRINITY_DN10848_c0_g1_i1:5-1567(+)